MMIMIHLIQNLDHHNPLSSWWRMQRNAPKLNDQSLQLEILVAIQCNDDDESQTSYGHICSILHHNILICTLLAVVNRTTVVFCVFCKLQNNCKQLYCRSRWQLITSWLFTLQCNVRNVLHCYIFTTGSWDPQLVKRGRRQEARYLTTKPPSPPLLFCWMWLKYIIYNFCTMHAM